MAYTVFARKYRPQTFEELVGQEHVAKTLAGAITAGRVAHAFLFTGVRGVGKTTTARLLAKALCCESGPTPTPCNTCDICVDITQGVDIDVQEIDGASNNGVEDVRRLQESLPYRPTRNRFKVVIVDEVHMLSTGAFNAFLKTLEEPPAHVKFIFATTESHKVPITIRSRCQRHDFRLIPQDIISDRVRTILDAESIAADDSAIRIVAREAAGSMRDALTLLDQLVAFSGGTLDGASVTQQLGIASTAMVHEVTRAVIEADAKGALEALDRVLSTSAAPGHFASQVLSHLRDAVVFRMAGDETSLVDLTGAERQKLVDLVRGQEPLELQRAFSAMAKLVDEVAFASLPRLVLEMGLVRIATRPELRGIPDLFRRLEALEKRLGPPIGGGSPRRGSGGRGAGGRGSAREGGSVSARDNTRSDGQRGPGERNAAHQVERDDRGTQRSDMTGASQGQAGPRDAHRQDAPGPEAHRQTAQRDVRGAQSAAGDRYGTRESAASSDPASSPPASAAAFAAPSQPARQSLEAPQAEAPHETRVSHEPASTQAAGDFRAKEVSISDAESTHDAKLMRSALQEWTAIVDGLRTSKPALAAVLEHGVPRAVSGSKIVLSFRKSSFYGRQAEAPAAQSAIGEVAEARFGQRPPIEIRYDLDQDGDKTVAAVSANRRDAELKKRKREALEHPAVIDARNVFPDAPGPVVVHLDEEAKRRTR